MKKLLLITLVVFALINSCKKNDSCSGQFDLPKDELSTEALTYNPYLPANQLVVFKDETGQEFRFSIERNMLQTSTNHTNGICPDDVTKEAEFTYENSYYKLYLRGIDMSLFFNIWISDIPKPNSENAIGEDLKVYASEIADGNGVVELGELSIYHSINIVDGFGVEILKNSTLVHDSLVILGTPFYTVIEDSPSIMVPKYKVYYNTEKGIVGFTNTIENKDFVFDRVEN